MKTKTYSVYTFDELSAKAKQRAKDQYAAVNGFNWSAEYLESLKELAAHFDAKLIDYQIDWFNGSYSSADFRVPEDDIDIAAKLAELGTFDPVTLKGTGECKLTGFCADEDAIDDFRIAYNAGERDLSKLLEAAFRSLLKAGQADCEAFYSDEIFSEHCAANGYEFDEDGNID